MRARTVRRGIPARCPPSITYRLEGSSLILHYQAAADRTSVCNLTCHAYWNLNGQGSGSAMGHTLTLFADRYTPVVHGSIPTGAVDPVEGTPLDFRTPRVIGERVDEPFRAAGAVRRLRSQLGHQRPGGNAAACRPGWKGTRAG